MNIFKSIKNYFLDKNKSLDFFDLVEPTESFIEAVTPPIEEVEYISDVIASISTDGFLNATDPLSIAKYKNNLKILVEQAKHEGRITKFKTIREDNFLPFEWEWRVASKDTGIEKVGSNFSYTIKEEIALKRLENSSNNQFSFRIPGEDLGQEIKKLNRDLGLIYLPVHFRSTKHFTVNTPLGYTGEYNCVDTNRLFTIIDDIDNFLMSGYAYSADYRDAYLDVTHEGLKISPNAVVLIAEDKYEMIMSNPNFANQLHERRVIIYRGDESVAINMFLSENGVLPNRPGNKFIFYDEEIRSILENSMRSLCQNNGIEYSKGHGNINGRGGHFSDIYDGYNHDVDEAFREFANFLKSKFPNYAEKIDVVYLKDSVATYDIIKLIGVENILQAIDEYNQLVQQRFVVRFQTYLDDRKTITPEISQIFKTTLLYIRKYYFEERENNLDMDTISKIRELIRVFMHSNRVEEQLLAAQEICKTFGVSFIPEEQRTNNVNMAVSL